MLSALGWEGSENSNSRLDLVFCTGRSLRFALFVDPGLANVVQ